MAEPPLRRTITDQLRAEIAAGGLSVGDRLPSEHELSARFGVSRNTMREALRRLQDQGLIVRRQGSGTVVAALQGVGAFHNPISTIEELVQYAANSRVEVLSTEKILVEGATAALLRSAPDEPWMRISGLRRIYGQEEPFAYTEIFLPADYADVAREIGSLATAVYAAVENRYGIRIEEVEQTLEAVPADANLASRLGVVVGTPMLVIRRHYLERNGKVAEVAVNWHPAGRYRYGMTLQRSE